MEDMVVPSVIPVVLDKADALQTDVPQVLTSTPDALVTTAPESEAVQETTSADPGSGAVHDNNHLEVVTTSADPDVSTVLEKVDSARLLAQLKQITTNCEAESIQNDAPCC